MSTLIACIGPFAAFAVLVLLVILVYRLISVTWPARDQPARPKHAAHAEAGDQ